MQKFAFVLLTAVAALLVFVPLIEGAAVGRRMTNAERFARGMTPLPPVKRTKTFGARNPNPSHKGTTTPNSGLLGVFSSANNDFLGYVNNPSSGGSFGIDSTQPPPADADVICQYSDGSCFASNANFSPSYIGGSGPQHLMSNSPVMIQFTNVPSGPSAAIWNMNTGDGTLTASWPAQGGSRVQLYVLYNTGNNQLSFTNNLAAFSNLEEVYLRLVS